MPNVIIGSYGSREIKVGIPEWLAGLMEIQIAFFPFFKGVHNRV